MNKNVKIILKSYTLGLIFIVVLLSSSIGNCFTMFEEKDTISELSFSHDGKKVVFDRCRNEGCQIQVYDL
jgi:Tol biopolymer transport system component